MSLQATPLREQPIDSASAAGPARAALLRPLLFFLLGFLLWYAFFWGLQRAFPYVRAGSDLVDHAKLRDAAHGEVFPRKISATKIAVFGDSRILAGLVPKRFDQLAQADCLRTCTYNLGLAGNPEFLPLLKELVDSGDTPDVVLLTIPWQPKRKSGLFNLPWTNEEIADALFPFRTFIRDAASFAYTARQHGGLLAFFRESRANIAQIRRDRGYYFISEQSHYPKQRLPDNFHMVSDQPDVPFHRDADPSSPEIAELNTILRSHSIQCLYVPYPLRGSSVGQPAPIDTAFQQLLESKTPCKLIGPDYYRYPNRLLSDQTHLNHAGARLYTEDLYKLVRPYLTKETR